MLAIILALVFAVALSYLAAWFDSTRHYYQNHWSTDVTRWLLLSFTAASWLGVVMSVLVHIVPPHHLYHP
jgi:predicted PurR-regulated permease PerM